MILIAELKEGFWIARRKEMVSVLGFGCPPRKGFRFGCSAWRRIRMCQNNGRPVMTNRRYTSGDDSCPSLRAPARETAFRPFPLASPSGPLYIERMFPLRRSINQLIHCLHLYRSRYSNRMDPPNYASLCNDSSIGNFTM